MPIEYTSSHKPDIKDEGDEGLERDPSGIDNLYVYLQGGTRYGVGIKHKKNRKSYLKGISIDAPNMDEATRKLNTQIEPNLKKFVIVDSEDKIIQWTPYFLVEEFGSILAEEFAVEVSAQINKPVYIKYGINEEKLSQYAPYPIDAAERQKKIESRKQEVDKIIKEMKNLGYTRSEVYSMVPNSLEPTRGICPQCEKETIKRNDLETRTGLSVYECPDDKIYYMGEYPWHTGL